VLDLVERLRESVNRTAPGDDEDATFNLVRELAIDDFILEPRAVPGLHLIQAGDVTARDYSDRVATFDWAGLFTAAPYLFKALALTLAERYRYVLIDSRTGVTDTSGICTSLLPEKLVVVFTPNRQSLDGAVRTIRSAIDYRLTADDLRPLTVYPLASRVELSEDELRRQWRGGSDGSFEGYQRRFETLFRELYDLPDCSLKAYFDEVQIQQQPHYAYGEDVAVLNEDAATDRLSLARSYGLFTRAFDEVLAPWQLEPSSAAHTLDEQERERRLLPRIGDLIDYNRRVSVLRRRRYLVARVLQALLAVAAVAVAVIDPKLITPAAAGVLAAIVIGLLELLLRWSGAPEWWINADTAEQLRREYDRYDQRIRGYDSADAPVALLAARVDEITADGERRLQKHAFSSPFSTRRAESE
jgi:hypothetical protein